MYRIAKAGTWHSWAKKQGNGIKRVIRMILWIFFSLSAFCAEGKDVWFKGSVPEAFEAATLQKKIGVSLLGRRMMPTF